MVYHGTNDEELNGILNACLNRLKANESMQICFSTGASGTTRGTTVHGTLIKTTSDYATLYVCGYMHQGTMLIKTKYAGVWSELEWVNPPMELGVEYRTTERWGGKPVYTKAVFIPTLPNNTHINSPISGKKTVLSAEGYATDLSTGVDYMFPVVGYSDGKITATFMHSVGDDFYIKTYVDLSNWSANFIVKYTKD